MNQQLVIPTAEPYFIPGGEVGCLLLHGITGTPKEMRLLADSLAQDGNAVLAPRLFAHATKPEDMNRARYEDWIASVEDGLNLLRGCTKHQFVMGLSMGGILTLIMAARFEFKGLVSFSTPCDLPRDPRAKFLPIIAPFMPKVEKGEPDFRNLEIIKTHIDYPYYPTQAILQLRNLIREMRASLSAVRIPALFVQSRGDLGIPPESMDVLYAGISSPDKTRIWVENSGHVVICEPDRETIFTQVKGFMKRVLSAG